MKKSIILVILGSILEYYDFAIFIYFAKQIGQSLIPIQNSTANLITSFGILAIGAIIRPLGGVFFSQIGDTKGRKNIFIFTILLMALPTFAIGLIPSYQSIGIWSTITLILLRSIQGLAIGGEIPGSIVFAYELSKPQNRALNTNIVIAGTNIGFFLASLFGAFLISQTKLGMHSWRIAFMIGGLFGIISYFLRKNLSETPQFQEYKIFLDKHNQSPMKLLWSHHQQSFWQIVTFSSLLASSLAVFTFFMPTYLTTYYNFQLDTILKYNSYSIIIFIISALIAGKFDFLFGKKFLLISIIIFNIANFWLFSSYKFLTINKIAILHLGFLFYIGIICGRLPVLVASFFPTQVRFSGVALSYNISFGLVAGLSQVVLLSLIKITGILLIPAIYIFLFSIISLIFIIKTPSTKFIAYHTQE